VTRRLAPLLAAVTLAAPGVASAAAVTGAELRALAERAADDPAALTRLRSVDSVDGRPVDLRAALAGVEGEALRDRLRVLAESGERIAAGGSPREDAARILSDRRFRESEVPRPFHGLLVWIREQFAFVGRPFEWLAERIPGGPRVLWTLLAGAAIALAVFVARRTAQRRAGRGLTRARERRDARGLDPRELERRADEAERRGDLEAAVRLRFRAGLLRLGSKEVIPRRESLTTGQVRRLVRLKEFDGLARSHDEIAYGGRAASRDDAEAARAGWPVVLAKAVAR
jgi:hypothetical protein